LLLETLRLNVLEANAGTVLFGAAVIAMIPLYKLAMPK
jgi:hypothetical protein